MALDKQLSTPIAILIAGGLIAAGLFFGLRGRDSTPSGPVSGPGAPDRPGRPAVTDQAPQPGHGADGPGAAAPPREPLAPAPAATADRNAVLAAAMKDIERHRAAIVDKCVKPALAKKPDPPTIKLVFNVTFDAKGQQITRGVSEDRATSRYEVTQCVTDALPPLEVPPPGVSAMVDIPWTLP